MNMQLSNLPPDITTEDIAHFLCDSLCIKHIMLCNSGNTNNVLAMIKVDASNTGTHAIARYLDGKYWMGRHIYAYAMTFLNE